MQAAIDSFGDQLKQKGGVGLFYFAGHGVQLSGENYLLPVGGHIRGENDIKTGAVTATEIVDAMASARNGLNIVVLDACRNNPINKGATRGLSRIDSNQSLFVFPPRRARSRWTAKTATAPTLNISPHRSPPPTSTSRRPSSAR